MGEGRERRLNIRVTDDQHVALTAVAQFRGVSLQSLVEGILAAELEQIMQTDEFRTAAQGHVERQMRALGVVATGSGATDVARPS